MHEGLIDDEACPHEGEASAMVRWGKIRA